MSTLSPCLLCENAILGQFDQGILTCKIGFIIDVELKVIAIIHKNVNDESLKQSSSGRENVLCDIFSSFCSACSELTVCMAPMLALLRADYEK